MGFQLLDFGNIRASTVVRPNGVRYICVLTLLRFRSIVVGWDLLDFGTTEIPGLASRGSEFAYSLGRTPLQYRTRQRQRRKQKKTASNT